MVRPAFFALSFLLAGPQSVEVLRPDLDTILAREAEYCRKLERAALDFVCLEDITEKFDRSKDIRLDQPATLDLTTDGVWTRSGSAVPRSRVKRTFLYDFQFIREGGRVRETRTLLRENGRKTREEKAALKTSAFVYQNALLGPVAIFGSRWRDLYDYRVSAEAAIGGRRCLVIDVMPTDPNADIRFLFGRAYVDKATMNILKIEWSEERIGNYEVFEKRGERYGLKPHITVTSEFGVEKNGIRFPSRHLIEEAYLNPKGTKFVRSQTSVAYRDFRFFTVTVEDGQAK